MRPRRTLLAAALTLPLLLVSPTRAQAPDRPPAQELLAESTLPPGNSGFVSLEGQVRGMTGDDPSDFGPHLDDQRALYWSFKHKPGAFHAEGTPEQPKDGVRIYRDGYGVPSVYGDTGRDVWWGAGYAAAQDRLFLMDAVRRTGEGTLAELTGAAGVPADVQRRVLTYSDAEYAAFFAGLSKESQDAIAGYVDGANAWREKAILDPRLLPAEYALLTSVPAPFTIKGVVAGGVEITRVVAAEGGNEFLNVEALRLLEQKYGKAAGRRAFQDLVWQDDPKAAVTVQGRSFPNQPGNAAQRAAAFDAMADYAATLPLALATGPGNGGYPVPDLPPGAPSSAPSNPLASKAAVAKAARALDGWRAALHGGSFAVAVAPQRTTDGVAKLISEPQLGYSYPSLLWELEVHGGGYDARGVSVPGLPTVGIGYGKRVAWALTTGYSKTVDSFIETTRDSGGTKQYRHDGQWKDQECRDEVVRYRADPEGVPTGPPVFSETVEVCRTVHGPVVATTADGAKARSVQYAMFKQELQNIEGILAWNKAQDLGDFSRAMRDITWNENTLYADADGHIAYWHPGRFLRRSPLVDMRLPAPGTGEYDASGYLSFEEMPHAVDPPEGYLASWNNKPAHGWLDGIGIGDTSRPGGPVQRVSVLQDELARAKVGAGLAGVEHVDRVAGVTDMRAPHWRPLLTQLRAAGGLNAQQVAALDAVLGWDGTHYGPDSGGSDGRDSVGATVFDAWVRALRAELFTDLPTAIRDRQAGVGSHLYDMPPIDNLARRALVPGSSGLPVSRDYTGGRTPVAVARAALVRALDVLELEYEGAAVSGYRRPHATRPMCSLTGGVIGPCIDVPFLDRGSWIHLVSFRASPGVISRPTQRPPRGSPGPGGLPATGQPAWLAATALAAAAAAAALMRRRARRRTLP